MKPNKANAAGGLIGGHKMRTRTAVAVLVLSGLTWIGVPSAAADELPPTEETSSATAPADEPAPEPTPEASEVPTSEVTTPEPDATATPTEVPAEPKGEGSPATSDEALGVPTEATHQTPPAEETGDTQTVEEGEAARVDEAPVTRTVAAAAVVRDQRASIGDVNCTNLTVPVTLDNSRSAEEAIFSITRTVFNQDPPTKNTFDEAVFGGQIDIVNATVTEDSQVSIAVEMGGLPLLATAFLTVDCTDDAVAYDPRASIGVLDCAEMTVDVTVDNSRSEDDDVVYLVTWQEDDDSDHEQTISVPAGGAQPFLIHLTENARGLVPVGVWLLAEGTRIASESFLVDCDQPGDEPRASIGEVNCTNLTVPVTLDNTRSSVEGSFFVMAEQISGVALEEPYQDTFAVAGGAQRDVRVPIPNKAQVNLFVELDAEDPLTLADETFEVDCERPAAAPAQRPTIAVEGTKLPQTGGFDLALPLLGLALLTGGACMLALSGRRTRC